MKASNKPIVFFSATTPTVMLYKMARLFKNSNHQTILLTICEKNQFNYNFYKQVFNKIICSDFQFTKSNLNLKYLTKKSPSLLKFLIIMKFLKPKIVIGISGNNWQLKFAHKYFFKDFPFIYFPYDIISHFYESKKSAIDHGTAKFEVEAERYCFEVSNGIIHKGGPDELQAINGRIHHNLNLNKPQLSFMPYCSEEFKVPINNNKLSNINKEFHFVYVGAFPTIEEKELINKFSIIINSLSELKIHLHTYTTMDHLPKEKEKEYIEKFFSYFKNNKYFHIHKSLPAKPLIPEISKYDFGFFHALERKEYNLDPIYTIGNKIASYLEAGIPFIYEDSLISIHNLMKSYNLSIPINLKSINNLKKTLDKIDYEELQANIIKARDDFDMDKNFPRLKQLIEQAIDDKNNQFIY